MVFKKIKNFGIICAFIMDKTDFETLVSELGYTTDTKILENYNEAIIPIEFKPRENKDDITPEDQEKIDFLWNFFIDLKDEGYNVSIRKGISFRDKNGRLANYENSKRYIIVDTLFPFNRETYHTDKNEKWEDNKHVSEILNRLKGIGIVPYNIVGRTIYFNRSSIKI